MGVVDFDPDTWSRTNDAEAADDVAKVAKLAKVAGNNPLLSQLSQLSQPGPLPIGVTAGLETLQSIATPRLIRPERWPGVVSDALVLARDGWAAKALALGWADLDLFGCAPDQQDNPTGDGLAVWLAGRKMLVITAEYAVVDDGGGGRSYLNRRSAEGAALLWELGKVSRES